jgi:hypothetical protein
MVRARFCSGNLKETDHMKPKRKWSKMLPWVFKKLHCREYTGWIPIGIGKVTDFCQRGDEQSSSIKSRGFLD